jgi:hypothetical protein
MEEFEFACVALAREYSSGAEQCIINTKGMERAWEFLLQVLEVSSVPLARTQASILLAGVLVQKWDEMSEEERGMVKDSILHRLKTSQKFVSSATLSLLFPSSRVSPHQNHQNKIIYCLYNPFSMSTVKD